MLNKNEGVEQIILPLNGLVLSGGKSTRMGTDKGEIQYHGVPQRKHVYEMLAEYCESTFVSCSTEQSSRITDLSKIEDLYPDAGPLSGILSAFYSNPNVAWLAVACDLPFLTKETITYLVNCRNPSKMATAFWNTDSRFPEPVVAIWEPSSFSALLKYFNQGFRSPGKFLLNCDTELLTSIDALAFRNVNTIEEYSEVLLLLNKKV